MPPTSSSHALLAPARATAPAAGRPALGGLGVVRQLAVAPPAAGVSGPAASQARRIMIMTRVRFHQLRDPAVRVTRWCTCVRQCADVRTYIYIYARWRSRPVSGAKGRAICMQLQWPARILIRSCGGPARRASERPCADDRVRSACSRSPVACVQ